MSAAAPKSQLIYVLWGSDRFTRDEQVRGLKRRMLAEPCGDYNLSVLSGDQVTVRDVKAVADALPFIGERRLVVVEGLLGRAAGQGKTPARRGGRARTSTAKSTAPKRGSAKTSPAKDAADDENGPVTELVAMFRDLPANTHLDLQSIAWLDPERYKDFPSVLEQWTSVNVRA